MALSAEWDSERLRALHEMRAAPGVWQFVVRFGVQAALVAFCMMAFAESQYALYGVLALASAVWYGGLLSLSHDALHHRLTGTRLADEAIARIISWPLAWPIGVYSHVHLGHHRWAGTSFKDPERIQPTRTEYDAARPFARWYYRNQVWFNVFVAGGFGLLARLTRDAWRNRAHLPSLARAAAFDALGFLACTALWGWAAFVAGGWPLFAAAAAVWMLLERVVGGAHQLRNHAEHYGLWGTHPTRMESQYQCARDINAHWLAAWYFNHLNRHATHHALMSVPFYKLDAAHQFLRSTLTAQGLSLLEPRGYIHEVLAANRLARQGGYIPDDPRA